MAGLLLLGGVGRGVRPELPAQDGGRAAARLGERGLHAAARAGPAQHLVAGRHGAGGLRRGALRARRAPTRSRRPRALAAARRPFLAEVAAAVGNLAAVVAVLLVGRYALNWVVGVGRRASGSSRSTVNLVTAPAYSEAGRRRERHRRHRPRSSRAAGRDRRSPAGGREPIASPPIAAGSRRSSRCCSPFTSAAWASTGRRSASSRRWSRCWATSSSRWR